MAAASGDAPAAAPTVFRAAEAEAYLARYVDETRRVYEAAARELERILAKATATDFARFRAAEQLKQVRAVITALDVQARDLAEKAQPLAYERGARLGADQLRDAGVDAAVNMGNKIHGRAVEALTDQLALDLLEANGTLRRNVERFIRRTQLAAGQDEQLARLVAEDVVRGAARRETSERLREALAKELGEGVTKITVNGRNYDPAYYAELVARTRTREAVTQGTINTAHEFGVDLVQVSYHASSCPVCVPFQGRVYSLRGETEGFPRLDRRPPFHPNCAHVLVCRVAAPGYEDELDRLRAFTNGGTVVRSVEDYQKVVKGGRGAKATAKEAKTAATGAVAPAFKPAATIKEAEDYAVKAGLAKRASYKGLDLDAANAMNQSIEDAVRLFPELRGRMDFIGSYQTRNRELIDQMTKTLVEQGKFSEPFAKKFAMDRYTANRNAWAVSTQEAGYAGITLNEYYAAPGKVGALRESLKQSVESRFHPAGCEGLRYIADHEMGHQIDSLIGLKTDPRIADLYANRGKFEADGKTPSSITTQLSEYAQKGGVEEFIAEAWAEFVNNPNPRWIAREVGEIITAEATRRANGAVAATGA